MDPVTHGDGPGRGFHPRYRVSAKLKQGDLTEVYLVEDRLLGGRQLALKCQGARASADEGRRYLSEEFDLLSHLYHPNIVTAYDFVVSSTGDGAFFTQEYVEGKGFLEATGSCELGEIAFLFAQACVALDYLHRRGVVHGDIKPSHIVVSGSPDVPEEAVKLIDFGLACRADRGARIMRGGTPPYMAPEVETGAEADHRCDIYSLGMVLLATMAKRFRTGAPDLPLRASKQCLRQLIECGMPAPLGVVLEGMTAWSLSDRYGSLREVIRTVQTGDLDGSGDRLNKLGGLRADTGTSTLVGRDGVLAAFQEDLAGLPGGVSGRQCLIVTGEPGIGKTRLLDELRIRAQLSGIASVVASFESGSGPPYGPFHKIVAFLRSGLEGDDGAIGDGSEALVGSDESVANLPSGDDPGAEGELQRKWEAICAEILDLCDLRPALICIDDIHLADREAMDLWACLVRSLPGHPVYLVTSGSGQRESPEHWGELLDEMELEPCVRREELKRLSPEETAASAAHILGLPGVDHESAVLLHRNSGGNPLYLRSIIGHLHDEGLLAEYVDAADLFTLLNSAPMPPSLDRMIEQRYLRLSRDERNCLSALAVANRASSVAGISQIGGLTVVKCRKALHQLRSRGLVQPVRAGREVFDLVHSESREHLRQVTPEDAWGEFHGRAAAGAESLYLSGETGLLEEVARHYHAAGNRPKAAEYVLDAAREAMRRGSFERAQKHYAAALSILDVDDRRRAEAIEERGLSSLNLGDIPGAIGCLETALKMGVPDPVRGRILRKLADARFSRGELAEAMQLYDQAVRLLDPTDNPVQYLRLRLARSRCLTSQGAHSEAEEDLVELNGIVKERDPFLEGFVCEFLGDLHLGRSRFGPAAKWAKRAARAFGREGYHVGVSRAERLLGNIAYLQGRYAEARALYERTLTTERRYGLTQSSALDSCGLANIEYIEGDLAMSASHNRDAARFFERTNNERRLANALNALSLTQLMQGNYRSAAANLERAEKLREWMTPERYAHLKITEAFLGIQSGDSRLALAALGQLESLTRELRRPPSLELLLKHLMGRWHTDFGDRDEGRGLLGEYLEMATSLDKPSDICIASCELARCEGTALTERLGLARKAQALAVETGHKLNEVEAALTIGAARFEMGDHDLVIRLVSPVVQVAERAGMKDVWWRAQCLLAAASDSLERSRYALLYDRQCLALLNEMRSQFDDEEAWRDYLGCPGRIGLYRGLAGRVPRRNSGGDDPG